MKLGVPLSALSLLAAAAAGGALGACTPSASTPTAVSAPATHAAVPPIAAASDAAPQPPPQPASTAAAPSASAPADDTDDTPDASTAAATDAGPPRPHEVFVATILAVGPPARIACGFMMATQNLTVKIEQVTSGALYPGQRLSIPVLTCLAGGLLVPIQNDRTVAELDPTVIKPGVKVAFDIEIDPDEGRLASAHDMHVVP